MYRVGVLLAMVLLVGGCSPDEEGQRQGGPPALEQARSTTNGSALPPIGRAVDFTFYTHCGVESAQIGGVTWRVVTPLYAEKERGNPPEGWGNPFQDGKLTLLSPTEAVFEARGVRVPLVPADPDQPEPICY